MPQELDASESTLAIRRGEEAGDGGGGHGGQRLQEFYAAGSQRQRRRDSESGESDDGSIEMEMGKGAVEVGRGPI